MAQPEMPKQSLVSQQAPGEKLLSIPNKPLSKEAIQKAKKKKYNVFDLYWERGYCVSLAKNKYFEYVTLGVISLNAIWIGVDTDLNPASDISTAEIEFLVVENIFCFYFSFELIIRFLAFREKKHSLTDMWFCFDMALVLLMVMETWVFPLVISASAGGFLSILRLFRLLRLTRMTRLMRSLPELLTLIKGMRAAARSVISTLVLLIIILYIFGILFSSLYGSYIHEEGCRGCQERWSNVPASMFTLFVAGTLLDDITVVCDDIRNSDPGPSPTVMMIFFLIYFMLSSLTVLNMLIGVVCEVISDTASQETENAMVAQVTEILTVVFEEIDADGSGLISKKEFELMTDKRESIEALHILGVEPKHLLALSDTLFDSLDDGKPKEIDFHEFLEMVVHLRPENNASVLDIAQLRGLQRRLMLQVEAKIKSLCDQLDLIQIESQAMSTVSMNIDNSVPGAVNGTPQNTAKEQEELLKKLQQELQMESQRVDMANEEIERTQRDIKQLLDRQK